MLVDISSVVLDRNTRWQNRRKQGVLIFSVDKASMYLSHAVCEITTTVFSASAQLGDHVT